MLALSRRIGETIVVAGGIAVTVLAVHGRQIRLGVTVPAGTAVLDVPVDGDDVVAAPDATAKEPMP